MAVLFRPPQYVPNKEEESLWIGKPSSVPAVIAFLAVLAAAPFANPQFQKFNIPVEDIVGTSRLKAAPLTIELPPVVTLPFANYQFQLFTVLVEDTSWQWQRPVPVTLSTTAIPLPFFNPRSFNFAEDTFWQWKRSVALSTDPLPFANLRQAGAAEETSWQWKQAVPLTITLPFTVSSPFTANLRQFGFVEDVSWQRQQLVPLTITLPSSVAVILPFVNIRSTSFSEDFVGTNRVKAAPLTIELSPSVILPFVNLRRFNFVEENAWQWKQLPLQSPDIVPFTNFHSFNYDEDANWQSRSVPLAITLQITPVILPFTNLRQVVSIEETSFWVNGLQSSSLSLVLPPLQTTVTLPFANHRAFIADEIIGWQGNSRAVSPIISGKLIPFERERIATVGVETRIVSVKFENRIATIPAIGKVAPLKETRVASTPTEIRIATPPEDTE